MRTDDAPVAIPGKNQASYFHPIHVDYLTFVMIGDGGAALRQCFIEKATFMRGLE